MSLVFIDSFAHYNNILLKWSSGQANYNTNPATIRTGPQSFNPFGGSFSNIPRINFANRRTITAGIAYYQEFAVGNQIFYGFNQSAAAGIYGELDVQGDGSLVVKVSNIAVATSAPGVIGVGAFYYVEMQATFQFTGGSCIVKVNGAVVINYSGPMSDGANFGIDSFLVPGSAVNTCFYNDFYLLDNTGTTNNTFLGAVQIYAFTPNANETPLQWTPLTGSNFSEVNQVPPPGDSAYVFSATVGAIDQYKYPITGIPGVYTLKGIQHCICCRLDSAGSHSLFSQLNATQGQTALVGSNAVGSSYQMVLTPYDTNPNTGVAFQPIDFATTFLGPVITA